jgi:hypothetical protein
VISGQHSIDFAAFGKGGYRTVDQSKIELLALRVGYWKKWKMKMRSRA